MTNTAKTRQGSAAILDALRLILKRDQVATTDSWEADREKSIEEILVAAGPMPEKAAGALAVLAEFVLVAHDAGLPDLTAWRPIAAR